MRTKYLLIALTSFLFYCQYFEDISSPEDLPQGTPLDLPEASKFFQDGNSFDLYEKQGKKLFVLNKSSYLIAP